MNHSELAGSLIGRASPELQSPGSEVLLQVRRRARWIAGAALAGALALGALAVAFPKYEAAGFYYTPSWGLPDYKRFRSEFGSEDVLRRFLDDAKDGNEAAKQLLATRATMPNFWEVAVKPLYPITKRDAKEIFETTRDKESASIMGLELALAGRDPQTTRDAVLMLGDYVTQTLQLTALQTWAVTGQSAANGELLKVENEVLRTRYAMEQVGKRIADLRDLQARYPEAMRADGRQVVNVDANSAKYLSPLVQVVALEAGLAESSETLRRAERRAQQLELEAKFFDAAARDSKTAREGRALLESLSSLKTQVFGSIDPDSSALREISTRFDLDLKGFRDQFTIGFGFRSPVLVPQRSLRSPTKFAVLGGALGLLAALAWILTPTLLRMLLASETEARVRSKPAHA